MTGVVLVGAALVVLAWVPFRWWGPTGSPVTFALLALTPVVAAAAVVVTALAFALRRRMAGATALVAALALTAVVVPRALVDGDPVVTPGPGTAPVVVATANLQLGRADPGAVVAMVREARVDVLGLQELTPRAERALAAAGLGAELPFTVSRARPGAGGTALVARHPLAPSGLILREGVFSQVTARVLAPSGPVDVVVAHPAAPLSGVDPAGWAREITDLPGPAAPGGVPRLVLGDLNATLDHRPLRRLLATGWDDAAATVGAGLRGTWPTGATLPPFAAIDHVLVSGRAAPVDLSTRTLPGTDHAAVVATLLVDDGRAGVRSGP